MIKSYRNKGLEAFATQGITRKISIQNTARLRLILAALDAAVRPGDMAVSGWNFHSLAPGMPGRYAVKASANYRVTFAFDGTDAVDVDLEDYH